MPRIRNIPLQFFVTESEKNLIDDKIEKTPYQSKSEYLRRMALDGFIINIDEQEIRNLVHEVGRIGNNINQTVKLLNETKQVYNADIESLKEGQEKIWQLLRYTLLRQP